MNTLFKEYDLVRVLRLNSPLREFTGTDGVSRAPLVGDVGAICHQYDPQDPKAMAAVEMVDRDGMTVWLADFSPDELELVSHACSEPRGEPTATKTPMKTCSQCGRTYDPMFVICECGSRLPDQTVSEVVAEWFGGEHTMGNAVHDAPEVAWSAILEILERELTDEQLSLLAAGPLEDLLALHGAQFIERVEREAAQHARFNQLLGGVWQNMMTMEIWERVQRARKTVW